MNDRNRVLLLTFTMQNNNNTICKGEERISAKAFYYLPLGAFLLAHFTNTLLAVVDHTKIIERPKVVMPLANISKSRSKSYIFTNMTMLPTCANTSVLLISVSQKSLHIKKYNFYLIRNQISQNVFLLRSSRQPFIGYFLKYTFWFVF